MIRFTKMHGAGNDYVFVSGFEQTIDGDLPELARRISHRRLGVGSDGLILILPSQIADARMRMFNADGSEGQMCGNGLRCVAKFLYDRGVCRRDELNIETGAGVLKAWPEASGAVADRVRIDVGEPSLDPNRVPTTLSQQPCIDAPLDLGDTSLNVTCLSLGNPHCVAFVPEATDKLVLGAGPRIENHTCFPERTNVEFCEVASRTAIRQRTWERGSGETWACGTGASAACVAGVLTGRTERKVKITLTGGMLEIEWSEADNHVYLTGPAVEVFSGEWPE